MNSKLVWAIIVLLVIYGAYLMMGGNTQAPVTDVSDQTEVVATTTGDVVPAPVATTTDVAPVPAN